MSYNFGKFSQKECSACSSVFIPTHPKHKYCSDECRVTVNYKRTKIWKEKQGPEFHRKNNLRYLYGITLEQYDEMVDDVSGKCEICSTKEKLYIDHDHLTGKIRGLLCRACNAAIGALGDNAEGVRNALEYLEKKKEYGGKNGTR